MKKNILIILLTIISVLSIVFAFIKADEAEKERMVIVEAMSQTKAEKERADELSKIAQTKAAEATMAKAEAERAMELYLECREGR
ncbi:hypothetical protein [Ekhidna sp.]|uniref:hypothetical protein n=1 Tax=Ekhidna sp. TaxID=2608089 RepID=UPI003B507045